MNNKLLGEKMCIDISLRGSRSFPKARRASESASEGVKNSWGGVGRDIASPLNFSNFFSLGAFLLNKLPFTFEGNET